MALVTMKEILLPARRAKRAVGAFNIANYETARAVIQAAEAEKSPVIIQLYMRLFDSTKAFDLAGSLIRMAHRFIWTTATTSGRSRMRSLGDIRR